MTAANTGEPKRKAKRKQAEVPAGGGSKLPDEHTPAPLPDAAQVKAKKMKKRAGTSAAAAPGAKSAGGQSPATVSADAPVAQPAVVAAGKKQRHKRKKAEDSAQLDPAEAARRQRQRELRALALKMRAEGGQYKPKRKRKSTEEGKPKEQGKARGQVVAQPAKKAKWEEEHESGSRPEGRVQVVIIPIYWNKKADEKEVVVAAAQRVQRLLAGLGLAAGCDTTNKFTPGQKFRYWEEKGVKVRVELGPREAASGECVLALAGQPGQPGQVARKTKLAAGAPLRAAVADALGLPPAASGGAELSSPADGGEEEQEPQPSSRHADTAEAGPGSQAGAVRPAGKASGRSRRAEQGGPGDSSAAPGGRKKATVALPSGDDLGDDFAIDVPEEETQGSGKRKKKKAAGASQSGGVTLGVSAGQTQRPQKPTKVVKF